ncbi:MAG: hypothetical protein UZ17_ACD001000812 [Acidobacteria bacterium OLB17]|nr:MAG: hypothetical protein UZ17_ACD001000812 [Acidobacteria bacterium OLB17]MCZ2389740.1 hypothetical protein [Acidobacteriota bacterium]
MFSVLLVLAAISAFASAALAHPEISVSEEQKMITVGDAPEQEVYAFGKSVTVTKRAKGVLAIGGDVVIEGRIEGDVATIGGNILQRHDAYVGGDVIVIGGSYKAESEKPAREEGKQTVVFGMMEEQLREITKDPGSLLSPSVSIGFFAQRLVLALIWFVISIVFSTIAPGAVGRAAAKLNLTPVKVCAIGAGVFLLTGIIVIASALTLPNFLAAAAIGLCMLLLLFGYVFGRIALHVSLGKWIQRTTFPENNRSETLATLTGVLVWTLILSLPFIWPIALFATFAFGIGLIVLAASKVEIRHV